MSSPPSQLYTGHGDKGYTSLRNNTLSKDDLLIDTLGNIDELNSYLGLILSYVTQHATIHHALSQVQHHLLDLGSECHQTNTIRITAKHVTWLEQRIDEWDATLPRLTQFILPGGSTASATTHIARSIARRAERTLVACHKHQLLHNPEQLRYINRLSDFLFALARYLSFEAKADERMWQQSKPLEK